MKDKIITINYKDINVDQLDYKSLIDNEFQIISLMGDYQVLFLN